MDQCLTNKGGCCFHTLFFPSSFFIYLEKLLRAKAIPASCSLDDIFKVPVSRRSNIAKVNYVIDRSGDDSTSDDDSDEEGVLEEAEDGDSDNIDSEENESENGKILFQPTKTNVKCKQLSTINRR